MTRVSLAKKVATAVTAGAMTFALVACTDSGEDTNTESTNAVSEESENSEANADGESERVGQDGPENQQIAQAADDYYTEVFTRALDGGTDVILEAQNEMVEASGSEEVFNSEDPHEAINGLDEEAQKRLLEVSEKYGNSSNYVNYDDLETSEKVLMNIITMMFKSMVAGGLGDVGIEIAVDENEVTVDGKNATISPQGILMEMQGESEPGAVSMDTPLIETKNGWKIDGAKFIEGMMAPVSAEEAQTVPDVTTE